MFALTLALLTADAGAATLDVKLAEKTATIATPSGFSVALGMKAGAEGAEEKATWENTESSAVSVQCAAEGAAPADEFVDQLLLTVGEDKWALAPGSNVKFACPAGKPVTVTDVHGRQVGQFKGPLLVSITRVRSHSAR